VIDQHPELAQELGELLRQTMTPRNR